MQEDAIPPKGIPCPSCEGKGFHNELCPVCNGATWYMTSGWSWEGFTGGGPYIYEPPQKVDCASCIGGYVQRTCSHCNGSGESRNTSKRRLDGLG